MPSRKEVNFQSGNTLLIKFDFALFDSQFLQRSHLSLRLTNEIDAFGGVAPNVA